MRPPCHLLIRKLRQDRERERAKPDAALSLLLAAGKTLAADY